MNVAWKNQLESRCSCKSSEHPCSLCGIPLSLSLEHAFLSELFETTYVPRYLSRKSTCGGRRWCGASSRPRMIAVVFFCCAATLSSSSQFPFSLLLFTALWRIRVSLRVCVEHRLDYNHPFRSLLSFSIYKDRRISVATAYSFPFLLRREDIACFLCKPIVLLSLFSFCCNHTYTFREA